MKIVCITPASDFRRFSMYRLGNKFYGHSNSITGPLILGHILKDAGHEVSVYEELYKDIDYETIKDADVYLIHTMTSSASRAYEIADWVHKETKGRVLIGGIHASAMPEEAAEHADQVMIGEGELVIKDVVEGRIKDRIIHCPSPGNLDEVPFPDYSLLRTPCECANVLTTRGCPFSCTFCTTSRMYHPYRERSVNSVIEELRYYKGLGFKYMNFEDDNFTANKERAKEICKRMIAEGLTFKETFFFGRTDLARDEELMELLQKAHLTRVLVGIESLNQKSLDVINKHQNIEDITKCAHLLAKHKIRLIASLVLGIDTDGPEDIQKAVTFTKKIHAYQLQPAILTPFPGTPVYQQFEKEHRMISHRWSNFDMMSVTFVPKRMTPWELQMQFLKAARRFYSFSSSFAIGRIFGITYGLRRMGLSILVKMGSPAMKIASLCAKKTCYYSIRHWEPSPSVKPGTQAVLLPDYTPRRNTLKLERLHDK
ncbi:MAG: radical SAM protein [Sphaerochaetaceae bacterium]